MNKQTQEALKMAIEALKTVSHKITKWTNGGKWIDGEKAINACKEALEQPAQSACEECIGFNKQLMAENDSLRNVIQQLENESKFFDEQPAQEPVAWMLEWRDGEFDYWHKHVDEDKLALEMWFDAIRLTDTEYKIYPLYTHPHQWQGLSDDEIAEIIGEPVDVMYSGDYEAYRAIEAKLKEKNT